MKINKLWLVGAIGMMTMYSCRNDEMKPSSGNYHNGIFITNEGNHNKPNAEVSFISSDLSFTENGIYSKANNGEFVGDVLNSAGFKGENAYLVVNNSNKIIIANRYTMKKKGEITDSHQPRYIAFANNHLYVTENSWATNERKLAIYNNHHQKVKTISFDRYSEKVVEAANFIYVQTDGVKYSYDGTNYIAAPTGHTITRINTSTNEVDKTITLTDNGIIKDMVSNNGLVYVLSASSNAGTTLYKIDGQTSNTEKISLGNVGIGQKLAVDRGTVYILNTQNEIYRLTYNNAHQLFNSNPSTYIYGFNVIDEKMYISEANNFTSNSKVTVYNASGTKLKTFTAGMGVNGFYKN